MFKYFTSRFGNDPISQINQLRKAFPGMFYLKGIHKDTKGIFVVKDTETKEYGEHYELENTDIFWNPTPANCKLLRETLSNFKTPSEERIRVKLKASEVTLELFPASCIPRVALLSRRKINMTQSDQEIYNRTDPYGILAYELFEASKSEKEMKLDDPRFVNFVCMVLSRSYLLPLEVLDALGIITLGDYDSIFVAGMGVDPADAQGELKKKDG